MCVLPSPLPLGYSYGGSGCAGFIPAEACAGLLCAAGYEGTPAVSCEAANGTFALSGCNGILCACARALRLCVQVLSSSPVIFDRSATQE